MPRIGFVLRFAKHFTVENNDGVGAEHEGIAELTAHRQAFTCGDLPYELVRGERAVGRLIGMARLNAEVDTDQFKQLPPPWGCGGKDKGYPKAHKRSEEHTSELQSRGHL